MAKSVLHDDAMVQMLKDDPAFAPIYLHQALVEIDEEGGYEAFMLALRHVIEATGGMSVVAKRAGLSRESLYLADEVFMTGTAAEVTPVRSVDGIQVGIGRCGPVTKEIQQAFFGLFTGKTEDKWGWLDPVNP